MRIATIILGIISVIGLLWATFGAKWFYLIIWVYTASTVVFLFLKGTTKVRLIRRFSMALLISAFVYLLIIAIIMIWVDVLYAEQRTLRLSYEMCYSDCEAFLSAKDLCRKNCDLEH